MRAPSFSARRSIIGGLKMGSVLCSRRRCSDIVTPSETNFHEGHGARLGLPLSSDEESDVVQQLLDES
eukprot:7354707-Alexandrium_andersonii.AAC.1